ncbi:AAA family ATPase [Maridesulfovibrio salexigens]|uniref:NadR-like protein n=1 Tax=Maridesulfovibrio salexigens (strain ATCC 14822 / DSM 2638 / NCIMB 8403 / VKM B-1763) TaxID=526222 RepID=C6C224_MARSD|nr:ATP-binding protein [Maridesulfovibrio salexigens]ACS81225.1 NadR-like protein [Maridesulfovibrio salexigens DSM 2638]
MLRVVLTGSECTGKSTLASKLAEHYKVEFVPEYLREYFVMKNGILTVDDVIPIAQGQLLYEKEAAGKGFNPLICDTDIISSIVYAKHYFGVCPDWLEDRLKELQRSIYLLCDIDVQWQADGQRDMPEERDYMQNLFISELESRNIPFQLISGSLTQRTVKSIKLIDRTLAASAK